MIVFTDATMARFWFFRRNLDGYAYLSKIRIGDHRPYSPDIDRILEE
jgi:hypothetical protein